jgi:hypothetical protein
MIVVVEGVSAAGKTTWCARHHRRVVPELPALAPPVGDPWAHAEFWTNAHCQRWAEAERTEAREGVAYCDTDPLKLHYTWCRWRVGRGTKAEWDAAVNAHRIAIQLRRLGFADTVVFLEPDHATVRSQKEADSTRRRRNFELHLQIGGPLREWYEMMDEAVPGRVLWHGEQLAAVGEAGQRQNRYDLALFEQLTDAATRRAG